MAGILDRGRPVALDELRGRAAWIRRRTAQLEGAPGLGASPAPACAEILAVLYYRALRLLPDEPGWPDRDRFLPGPDASLSLWPILADLGCFPPSWLDELGRTGHARVAPGMDYHSGLPGHDLSVGVGVALAARFRRRDHRTFVLVAGRELAEGQVWEAATAAGTQRLASLVAIVDAESAPPAEAVAARFAAFGWRIAEVDADDVAALVDVLDELPPPRLGPPTCVVARAR
jgi:transketolase